MQTQHTIKVEKKYQLKPSIKGCYSGELFIGIPCDDEELCFLFQSTNSLFNEQLTAYWGEFDYETDPEKASYRWRCIELRSDTSWQDLDSKLEEAINQAIQTLRSIKDQNQVKLDSIPSNQKLDYLI